MKKLTLTLLLTSFLSSNFQAGIDILTVDAFKIRHLGADGLFIAKKAESSNDAFSFVMFRPYCVCEKFSFVVDHPELDDFIKPEEDSWTTGSIRVDFKKVKEIEYEVFVVNPDYSIIEPRGAFPSLRNAKLVEIDTVYGKSKYALEGIVEAMRTATKMCESFIPYIKEKVEAKDMKT